MAFTYVTITHTFEVASDVAAVGTVEFTPITAMHNGLTVISAAVKATLSGAGLLSQRLAANTDPATLPTGTTYRVVEKLTGQPQLTYYVQIPHDQGSTLDLRVLAGWQGSAGGGGGSVNTINGESPDGSGNVVVSASDVGAQPSDPNLAALAAMGNGFPRRASGVWAARTAGQFAVDLVVPVALTAVSGVITPDATLGPGPHRHTATTGVTLASPTGGVDGQILEVQVYASGADRVLSVGGVAVTVTAAETWWGRFSYHAGRAAWVLDATGGGGSSGPPADGSITLVKLATTGTASASTFLRGDAAWATPTAVPADGSVTNVQVAGSAAISADKLVDGSANKIMTSAERTKLSGVATGATVYTDEQAQDASAAMITGGTHTGLTATYVDGSNRLDLAVTGSGYATVQDEGTGRTQRTVINFTGAGVTATDDTANGRTTINIPASGGGSSTDIRLTELDEIRDREPISVADPQFGGLVEGADNTATIQAAYTLAASSQRPVKWPTGNFTYSGAPFDCWWVPTIGDGPGRTNIYLAGAATYLYQVSTSMEYFYVRDLRLFGGKGLINHTYTGSNVLHEYIVERCLFKDYTGCVISSDASDMPYWKIRNCEFWGADYATTMGIALGKGNDLTIIESNQFLQNRVAVKLRSCGNAKIRDNDFIRFGTTRPSGPAIDVWMVPDAAGGTEDFFATGFESSGNKFGNENITTGDLRIVIADEGTGTTNGTKFPVLNADSTGAKSTMRFHGDTLFGGAAGPAPYIYSTTMNMPGGIHIRDLMIDRTPPTYLVQFRTPGNMVPGDAAVSTVGPILGTIVGRNDVSPPISNAALTPYLEDMSCQAMQGGTVGHYSAGDPGGRVELLTVANRPLTTWSLFNATRGAVTDAMNGTDAQELIFSAAGDSNQALSGFTAGAVAWIEFDIKRSTTSPLDTLKVIVVDNAFAAWHLERVVRVPTSTAWARYRVPWLPRTAGSSPRTYFQSTGAGRVQLGRVRVYHAREPQINDIVMHSPDGTKYKLSPPANGGGTATWTAV